jgi:hypothetical protein
LPSGRTVLRKEIGKKKYIKDYVQEVTKKAIRKNRLCKTMQGYMEEEGTYE